jgi:hypothetical protein
MRDHASARPAPGPSASRARPAPGVGFAAGRVLALQRAAGNAATARLIRPVVQREVTAQIETPPPSAGPPAPLTVDQLRISGRPASPFPGGTEGDHTTAFVVLAQGVRTAVVGHDLATAGNAVRRLWTAAAALPSAAFATAALPAVPAQPASMLALQQLIVDYLEFRGRLPLSALNTTQGGGARSGKGKGESAPHQAMLRHLSSTASSLDATQVMNDVRALLDSQGVRMLQAAVTQHDHAAAGYLTSNMTAAGRSTAVDTIALQHIAAIEDAYPGVLGRAGLDRATAAATLVAGLGGPDPARSRATRSDGDRQSTLATQIKLRDDGGRAVIDDIDVRGRALSPFTRTMGAHSTAWIVWTDAVRELLIGRTPQQALALTGDLDTLVTSAEQRLAGLSDPYAGETPFEREQHRANRESRRAPALAQWNLLLTHVAPAQATGDDDRRVLLLQQIVNAALERVNQVPGVSRDEADTGGAGEGRHRAAALDARTRPQARAAIFGLVDIKQLDNDDDTKILLSNHLRIVETAYPAAYRRSGLGTLDPDELLAAYQQGSAGSKRRPAAGDSAQARKKRKPNDDDDYPG